MRTTIAVSGDAGSFSEEAGLLCAQREGVEADMIYAIDMEGVLDRVEKGEADFGVFPVVNSRGGLVQTAFEAMGRHLFELKDEIWMEVRQCLMVAPGTKKIDIKKIATHPQAISQCERYIKRELPQARLIDWEDTAKAAKDLRDGVLDKDTAVIAPARSAQIYGLELLEKGIQDNHPNLTTFIVVKKIAK
ncbi:MAG: chorismate mutase [Candidatus Magasanikbacteria bacterium CG10_big_fil_rev_8_21_14_0_10_40_10]|uniref:prephenate dehydratase n=1 Tax=Candidatus Magasanikbacteria bacterium CG10_big_fil_rev_8_21_14_0_10_40_10 TaxID=1974648 RepID=A0A2M6W498_9BACT|nr:MAG: chorismate mutase [Candidatus Magasanikbacteria bacterium CG10_big_fil_rev_8_21_14_0_10_40_10]